jgi:dihydrodipicolinate synthase/N-acetylneuraminate lyase
MLLGKEQLADLLDKALSVVGGRIPIFMWVTRRTQEETGEALAEFQRIIERNAYRGSVSWVDCPLIYHSNRGLVDYYRDLLRSSANPFILFNSPDLVHGMARPFKRRNIRTNILVGLAALSKVSGLIFEGSLDRIYNYARAAGRVKEFHIYEGDENHFLDHPGSRGVVSAGANLMPETWGRVTAFCLDISGEKTIYPDHLMQIWRMGRILRDLSEFYKQAPAAVIKKVLAEQGSIENPRSLIPAQKDISGIVSSIREVMAQEESMP